MLLWLEEAAVEGAMILACVTGAVLFILATWSALADWLRHEKSGVAGTEPAAPSAEAGSSSRSRPHGVTGEQGPA